MFKIVRNRYEEYKQRRNVKQREKVLKCWGWTEDELETWGKNIMIFAEAYYREPITVVGSRYC